MLNNDMKYSIAIYLQHYLAPSMTFVYRQIKSAETFYEPFVICSDRLENTDKFPFQRIYLKRRNFIRIKKSRPFAKIYGPHTLLSVKPKLSSSQINYFIDTLIQNKARIIHAHFGPSGIEVVRLAKELKIPLIVTFHGYDASLLLMMKKYVKNIQEVFNYAHIVTISYSMKKDLIKYGANEKKTTVIRCGIPVNQFEYIERESIKEKFSGNKFITFLQVSNFVEVKGHWYTIQAFKNFNERYENSKLILAGGGETKKNIEKLCKQLGISDKVEFPGIITEGQVFDLMKKSDVFLHHSIKLDNGIKEGLPTVVMEAMATGLPVVSTYHSAIPELITHSKDGFLVNERDVKGYTEALFDLKNCTSQIGLNARKKIQEKFNLSTEMERLFNLYNRLMEL